MSLLQHSRMWRVKAGVNSMIWELLALSWSLNNASTSTAPTPTNVARMRWSGGTLNVGDSACTLLAHPISTFSPRCRWNARAVAVSSTNSSAFFGLAGRPWATTTRSSLNPRPSTLPLAPMPSPMGSGSSFLPRGPA